METKHSLIPVGWLEQRIFFIRNQKVMLSADLAKLYGVQSKVLLQAVKRNIARFPEDFMFQLKWDEAEKLPEDSIRSQFVTLKKSQHIKYLPYSFTEQGVAMLSSVLRSPRAIQVNIEIIRTFVKLREMLGTHADLAKKIEQLEKKYDAQFRVVFDAIRQLMEPPPVHPKRQIGFKTR